MITKELIKQIFEEAKIQSDYYNCKIVWISKNRCLKLSGKSIYDKVFKALGVYDDGFALETLFFCNINTKSILICPQLLNKRFESLSHTLEDFSLYIKYAVLHEIGHLKLNKRGSSSREEAFVSDFAYSFFNETERNILKSIEVAMYKELGEKLVSAVEKLGKDTAIKIVNEIDPTMLE